MATTAVYRLGPVQYGSTTIGGITDAAVNTGSQIVGEARSGEYYPRIKALRGQAPTATFTSSDLAVALGAISSVGASLASNVLKLYARKLDTDGKIAAGGNHGLYTLRRGLLFPARLSCQHQGDATCDFAAQVSYDGSNDPIVWQAGQSLPAEVSEKRWTLSNAAIGGVGTNDLMGVEVDFGLSVSVEGSNSDIWPTQVSLDLVDPKITLRGCDLGWLGTVALLGSSVSGGTVVLRDRLSGGRFGTSTLTLTASGYAHCGQPYRASQRGAAVADVILEVVYDGTNAPIRVAAA